MEEENQVFGKGAEAVDSNINLESEDFNFYHQNKEEVKKNIDSSSKELTDFIDSLIQDVPAPTDEEVNAGIEKILERTHPEEEKNEVSKSSRSKKVTFRVLFIAALLSILSFSGLYVVGSNNNISIENGFVTFAKDTIKIVFFGENREEYITVDALLTDLELHGYTDILFPQEFVNNYDVYKVSVPEYSEGELKQVTFKVYEGSIEYTFSVSSNDEFQKTINFSGLENAKSININEIYVYVFDYGNSGSAIRFVNEDYKYNIHASISYSEIIEFAKTIR